MDKNWSEMNKEMQALLSKETTFADAIAKLIELRKSLFGQITQIVNTFPETAFYQMPFAGAEGYHSKTLGYSIWHIFRIEDIVAHEMIAEDQQILFAQGFDKAVHAPIMTTGNELSGEEIAEFSKKLDVKALYRSYYNGGAVRYADADENGFLSAEGLESTARVALEIVRRVANAGNMPVKREIPDDIREKVDKYLFRKK